jgi:UDP-N-acetylmuramoyl-L-alanyl-D-glutamate--2,6-diaminopimelate ligase
MNKVLNTIRRFIPKPIFEFFQPAYHWFLAFAAALVYGFPSRFFKVVGVTGTSGKTTVIEFLHAIFSSAGFKTASLSSLNFRIGDKKEINLLKMTMPGRFQIQKFLRQAKKSRAEYVFLEITSEGIKQYRHKFIKFYAAIFTNLSEEHLEAHGGFENYRKAKGELFKIAPVHILNGDDPNFSFFLKFPASRRIIYGKSDYPSDLNLNIRGEFYKINAAGALAFARFEGVSHETAKRALEKIKVLPGRMEFIETERDFKILIDYAFLPQSLRKIYEFLAADPKIKNLICVLGAAGGGRDKWKRPEMGKIAAEYCSKIILTNEDPYDENPYQILSEIKSGISDRQFANSNVSEILDRRNAIRKALEGAKAGDIVVITGKGAEPWIAGPHGTKIPWDDRRVAKEELRKLKRP